MTGRIAVMAGLLLSGAGAALPQKHEIGFTLGRLIELDRGAVKSKTGTALQANYGVRVAGGQRASLLAEVHLLASPQRLVTGPPAATRDYATLYLTPGLRVKLNPEGRIQPYVAGGGGYALYEHSTTILSGAPNPAPRHSTHGAFVYGGGADVALTRWLALRFEARDFYTPSPTYNAGQSGRQHNPVLGGGFVLRLGE